VVATGDEQRAALLRVAGVESPEQLASALSEREAPALLADLQAAGVPAELIVLDGERAFLDSAANEAAGLVARYPHPVYGAFRQPGAFLDFGDLHCRLDSPPPTLGQHSREILTELGYGEAEVDAFIERGIVVETDRAL
jgi:crotonobetainyl-CoA:carnitine CoA-transferase CaiB-like acyl-CoA transferase